MFYFFFFSSRRRHTRLQGDWSSDVCSSDLVLADVHTHPGGSVYQSSIDQKNPMVPVAGHTALILPHFGRTAWWSLKGIGVYEYLGNFRWSTHGAAAQESPRI